MKIRLEAADVDDAIAEWVVDRFPGWVVEKIKPIRLKEGGMAAEVELAHDNDE
jgi:hypothetical protein